MRAAQRVSETSASPIVAMAAFERAVVARKPNHASFETIVLEALETCGGSMLFRMGGAGAEEHVAAISVGTGDERSFALVILPDHGAVRVEPAATSANPLAGIAEAYAGLIDVLDVAA